jgi:hypothetical protein
MAALWRLAGSLGPYGLAGIGGMVSLRLVTVTDDDLLRALRDEVLRRSGAPDLARAAVAPSVVALEPDLAAVLRLRLGLDRNPVRPRTRAEVAEAIGLGGARVDEMIAALEQDAVEALGPPP